MLLSLIHISQKSTKTGFSSRINCLNCSGFMFIAAISCLLYTSEFRWNSIVSALLSGDRLTGVRLRDTVTGEESVVDCDGVFVSVGRQPATALAVGQLALDGGGYIAVSYTHLFRALDMVGVAIVTSIRLSIS